MEMAFLHPIFKRLCFCNDHYDGELKSLGDALGKDCIVVGFPQGFHENALLQMYENEGKENTDWLSWDAEVMSPINGVVKEVYINPVTNRPGNMRMERASVIVIKASNELVVCLAHIQNPCVKAGDDVVEGQVIAHVGNNGCCRIPHIHVGACKGSEPYAIVFDPVKVARVTKMVGEKYWHTGIYDEGYPKQQDEVICGV